MTVKLRGREKRRSLRELGYIKYLAGAKVKVWSLKRLTVENVDVLCKNPQANAGLLLGLHSSQGKFLGIGLLQSIDCVRKSVKVRTSVVAEPAGIVLGKVRLDPNFHEISEFQASA